MDCLKDYWLDSGGDTRSAKSFQGEESLSVTGVVAEAKETIDNDVVYVHIISAIFDLGA